MSLRKKRLQIIKQGFDCLQNHPETEYDQIQILAKLKYLEIFVSKATMSNLFNGKRVGDKTLSQVANGFERILESELGLIYNEEGKVFEEADSKNQKKVIPEFGQITPSGLSPKLPFIFHEKGRLFIAEKTPLIESAQKTIYEIGIRLRRFTDYLTTRSDHEYRVFVEAALQRGVDFKCYVLDPDSNYAHLYFTDRSIAFSKAKQSHEVIKEVINELLDVQQSFQKKSYSGTFRIFKYRHIPHQAMLCIDPGTANGQMLIQHYIPGEERRHAPTLQIEKLHASQLFERYTKALHFITSDAMEIHEKYN